MVIVFFTKNTTNIVINNKNTKVMEIKYFFPLIIYDIFAAVKKNIECSNNRKNVGIGWNISPLKPAFPANLEDTAAVPPVR